jgi:hypothetical protein
MSSLSGILVDVKKFFANLETSAGKFAAAFQKLFGKAPAALQTIENFVGEVAPVVTAAVALAAPEAEPEVAAALAMVETGLAAIQASATAANSGAGLLANLQSFAATVPGLLTGLAIKNPALQAKVTNIVNLVVSEAKVLIPAVEAWVGQLGQPQSGVKAAA